MIGPDFQRPGSGILEGGRVHPGVTAQIAAVRGRGAPLDPVVQEQAASALGDSFGDVRVHTDALASALARSVEARAFTTGSDIFFASGEFRPQSPSGRELIAHELAHVAQQRGAPTAGEMVVSQPGDALEQEAERAARLV
jgi:uncharacterized protein DUF4157